MNAERTEAYRRLISMLLTYPNQAAKILNKNATLLDTGLMKMMEEVATQMAAEKSQEAANFLKCLIAQLQDELTMTTGRIKITQPSISDRSVDFLLETIDRQRKIYDRADDSERHISSQSDKEKIYYLNSQNTYLTHLKNSKIQGRNSNEYPWSKWVALAILMGTVSLIFVKPMAKPFGQPSFFGDKSQNHQQ
jgi:hypothetical protein